MGDYLLPPVSDWAEWSTIFTDTALWRPAIACVWQMDASLRSLTAIETPARIEPGYPGTCAVFVVDEAAVIKFFPPMVARDFDRERAVYRLAQERVPGIPTLLGQGVWRDRIEWPYLVVSFQKGMAWREARDAIPRPQALSVLRQLGRTLRALHDIPLSATGAWPSAIAWSDFTAARLPRIGADLGGGTNLAASVIEEIERLASKMNWHASETRLLHADLTEDHLLLSTVDGHWSLTGLIDWGDAEVGDPLYDWVALWFSICRRDAALFHAFMEGYGSTLGFDTGLVERFTAMTFLHRFGANILGEILTPGQQRAITNLEELKNLLFGGLAD